MERGGFKWREKKYKCGISGVRKKIGRRVFKRKIQSVSLEKRKRKLRFLIAVRKS